MTQEMLATNAPPPKKASPVSESNANRAEREVLFNRGRETFRKIAAKYHTTEKIGQHTMAEWRDRFTIKVSDSPTLEEVRAGLVACQNNYQVADHFQRVTKAALEETTNNYKTAIAEEVHRLVDIWSKSSEKKPPAREVIETDARAACSGEAYEMFWAQVYADFWQSLVWMIKFQEQNLEAIQNNFSIEAKLGRQT